MKRMFSIVVLAMAVQTICAGESGGSGSGAPQQLPPYVTVSDVVAVDDVEVRRYTGQVTSPSSVNLVARVTGELGALGFREGDVVRPGEVLFNVDPVRYEAAVKSAEAKVAEQKARLAYARNQHERNQQLYNQKVVALSTAESVQSDFEVEQAALDAAEAALVTARDDLEHTRIVAPIGGKIGPALISPGNYVTASSGILATIVQTDPLRIAFSLSSRDYLARFGTEDNLKTRASLRLRLADDSEYEREGTVEFIDNHANRATDTVQVYARFANPDGRLIPGSTVTVLLSRRSDNQVAAVAPSAVMHDKQGAYVYVVGDGNTVERRAVTLAGADATTQRIASGLKPGERVVIDGMHKTMPGGVIEPDYRMGAEAVQAAGTRPADSGNS